MSEELRQVLGNLNDEDLSKYAKLILEAYDNEGKLSVRFIGDDGGKSVLLKPLVDKGIFYKPSMGYQNNLIYTLSHHKGRRIAEKLKLEK